MARTKTASKPAAKKTATKKTAKKASPKKAAPKKAAAKKSTPATKAKAAAKKSEEEVTIDRRRGEQREETEVAEAPKLERREKVNRRRQIDPTTCERDYSDNEVEFMNALDAYKRRSGRMFPTCSEVLEVIREIGYIQLSAAEMAMVREYRGETDEPTLESDAEQEATDALAESDELRVE